MDIIQVWIPLALGIMGCIDLLVGLFGDPQLEFEHSVRGMLSIIFAAQLMAAYK